MAQPWIGRQAPKAEESVRGGGAIRLGMASGHVRRGAVGPSGDGEADMQTLISEGFETLIDEAAIG